MKRLGENKIGLKPVIAFVQNPMEFNLDTDTSANNIVHIKVKFDCLCDKYDRTNITRKRFDGIQTFNRNGATVILTIKSLNYDIYAHEGLTSPLDVKERLKFFQRLLVGHYTRDSYLNTYIACRDAMMTEYNLDEAKVCELKKDLSNLFKYLCQDYLIPTNEISSLSATDLAEKNKTADDWRRAL